MPLNMANEGFEKELLRLNFFRNQVFKPINR
jgi:hypothetical protein